MSTGPLFVQEPKIYQKEIDCDFAENTLIPAVDEPTLIEEIAWIITDATVATDAGDFYVYLKDDSHNTIRFCHFAISGDENPRGRQKLGVTLPAGWSLVIRAYVTITGGGGTTTTFAFTALGGIVR